MNVEVFRGGHRALATACVWLCVLGSQACSAFDSSLLKPPPDTPEAARLSDGGAHDGAAADDGGGAPAGCIPNPDSRSCPVICPEGCDGKDDDCDGLIDEGAECTSDHALAACIGGHCVIAQCEDGYRDCDGDADSGCEIAPSDLDNCGGCNRRCSLAGSVADCSTGVCLAQSCVAGYADCDGNMENGCESLSSAQNCGGCGKLCNAALAQVEGASCQSEQCQLACSAGYADCDGDPATGCETLLGDLARCGGCDSPCAVPHAVASCGSGTCTLVSCEPGWGDCNDDPADGCEARVDTLQNCGQCKQACSSVSCAGGVCSAADCSAAPHSTECGGSHCADCNGDGADCEADLDSIDTCGSCNDPCQFRSGVTPHGTLSCAAQRCTVSCAAGYGDCNGDYRDGCETALDSLQNCGACAQACAIANAAAMCDTGDCRVAGCDADWADCDHDLTSCETQLGTTKNCAGCGMACDLPNTVAKCAGSAGSHGCAVSSCVSGFSDCDHDPSNGCETPGQCGLGYTPSNFDQSALDFDGAPTTTLDCQSTTSIDTSTTPATITNWCGSTPASVVQHQSGGPDVVILALQGFTLASGTTLRLTGTRPLILAVRGDVQIDGTIDASASGTTPGAGGNWSCGSSQGGDGQGYSDGQWSSDLPAGGSGAGGGGFATAGGAGGRADTDDNGGGSYNGTRYASGPYNGGAGGAANRGNSALIPLIGGCAGGSTVDLAREDCPTNTGAGGGGALQISAKGALRVTGTVRANGGVGATPCGASKEGGGSGGGSGGAILLEGSPVTTTGATVQTDGGQGGNNGKACGALSCGNKSGGSGSSSSGNAGRNGSDTQAGGSGGGGGYGRTRINNH